MPPELEEVQRWLLKARRDWQTAERTVGGDPPITDTAAFHCQQAIEKLLKAFLVWNRIEFEKVHDLELLASRCMTLDAAFVEIVPLVRRLTPYAVRYRYPGPVDPTVEEVKSAMQAVGRVWEFVMRRMPSEVHPE